jgi:hypothetical protein
MIRHLHLHEVESDQREEMLAQIFGVMVRMTTRDHDRVTHVDHDPPLRTPWPGAEAEKPVSTTTYTMPAQVRIHGIDPGVNVMRVTVFQDGTTTYEDDRDGLAMTRRGNAGPHMYHHVRQEV